MERSGRSTSGDHQGYAANRMQSCAAFHGDILLLLILLLLYQADYRDTRIASRFRSVPDRAGCRASLIHLASHMASSSLLTSARDTSHAFPLSGSAPDSCALIDLRLPSCCYPPP